MNTIIKKKKNYLKKKEKHAVPMKATIFGDRILQLVFWLRVCLWHCSCATKHCAAGIQCHTVTFFRSRNKIEINKKNTMNNKTFASNIADLSWFLKGFLKWRHFLNGTLTNFETFIHSLFDNMSFVFYWFKQNDWEGSFSLFHTRQGSVKIEVFLRAGKYASINTLFQRLLSDEMYLIIFW